MGYGASWASASKQWSWCSSSVPAFDDSVFDSSGCSERVYFPHRSPGSTAALCGRIAAGDLLHGVGETPVYELDRQQAMALLLGRDGSDVTLWMSKAPTDGEPRPPVIGVKVKRDSYRV